MNTLVDTLKYFVIIAAELTLLFLGISTIVALALMYLPQEKTKKWMSGRGLWGNFVGALIGALTPFCACSTIPMTLGFLEAGAPFGTIMSFVIASPLLNPIILALLVAMMGGRAAAVYFVVVFGASVSFGVLLEKTGGLKQVKNVRIPTPGDMVFLPEPARLSTVHPCQGVSLSTLLPAPAALGSVASQKLCQYCPFLAYPLVGHVICAGRTISITITRVGIRASIGR